MKVGGCSPEGRSPAWPPGWGSSWPTCGTRSATASPHSPHLAISTIFHGSAMPVMTPQAIPGEVVTGLVMHTALSITFGMGFAVLAVFLRNPGQLIAAAVLYGLALFVLNIEILGRTAFPFFTNPHGPNTVFEGFVHPLIFGGLLIPFFLGNRPAWHATLDDR